jgi:hypothetical protein
MVRSKIGNPHQMNTWRLGNLRDIHRREFPRADQAYTERSVFSLQELRIEIHK